MFRLFITVSVADPDECQRDKIETFEIRNSHAKANEGTFYDNHAGSAFARHTIVQINSPTSRMGHSAWDSRSFGKLRSLGTSASAPSSRRSSVDYRMRGGSMGNVSSLKSCPIGTAVYAVHCKVETRRASSPCANDLSSSEHADCTDSRLRTPSLSGVPGPYTRVALPPLSDSHVEDMEGCEPEQHDIEWTVYYRYSQWRTLFETMRRDKVLSQQTISLFPPKRLLSPGDDPEVVRERLTAFPRWLSAVTSDKKALAHPAFRRFLKLDKYAPELTREIQKSDRVTSRIPDVSYIGDLLQASPEFALYRDRVLAHHRGSPAAVLVPLPPLSRLSRVCGHPDGDLLGPVYSYEENVEEGSAHDDDAPCEDFYRTSYAYNSYPQEDAKPPAYEHRRQFTEQLAIVVPPGSHEDISYLFTTEDSNGCAGNSRLKAPTPSAPPLYEF